MPKKTRKIAQQRWNQTDCELRRWCIEQAIRWPTSGGHGYGQAVAGASGGFVPVQDMDVLGRAKRLLDWVVAGTSPT